MKKYTWRPSIEDYAPLIGADGVERIVRKAQRLRNLEVGQYQLYVLRRRRGGDALLVDHPTCAEPRHPRRLALDPGQPRFLQRD